MCWTARAALGCYRTDTLTQTDRRAVPPCTMLAVVVSVVVMIVTHGFFGVNAGEMDHFIHVQSSIKADEVRSGAVQYNNCR